ncbi:MAG: toprim domain-containing protein [Magnetovibrio sp.]|nr:toprim domain-containing protein [Magnetovibrio sp.]
MPKLILQGTHPAFVLRGISEATCRYLRCGYFQGKRGALKDRLVFQVGGIQNGKRIILSHIGRATTPDQKAKGKWRYYRGFNPSLELYNFDNLLLDKSIDTDTVILVEGAFDVAKCVEAGLKNVVATFGARLSDPQAAKLKEHANAKLLVFYDRYTAGQKASVDAIAKLKELNIQTSAFDWGQQFNSRKQKHKAIAEGIQHPCDFSVAQLRWLRGQGIL